MKIEQVDPKELKPSEYNPRQMTEKQAKDLTTSVKKFGLVDPIIVNSAKTRYNTVIGGHQRLTIALREGIKTVPVYYIELSEKAEQELNLRLNKNQGEWNLDLLANLDEALLREVGFDDELDKLFHLDAEEDDFDAPLPDEPVSKLGDIIELGRHRIMCGDATKLEDVEKLMNGVKADLFLTDPPYNVDYEGTAGKIKNDSKSDEDFRQFLRDAFASADAVMKEGAVFYIWHADSEGYNFRGACKDNSWEVRQCLIWRKDHMVMGRQDYHWKHEPCLYGWKEGASHLWATDRKQTTILDFERPNVSKLHPTMKPIGLMAYLMKNNTKGEDIVLDTFIGSGSTLIAAEQTGRVCYGMELDPKYCDIIKQRYEEFVNKTGD